ncbi:MAG: sel1 repeat family protein [Roseburia sp.]|nr:sel1 repeat family protein [Anaeroplasma bactoclasticum]MCM1196395.1 sel1 repeat family protein [Roseburia sp.]MCM1556323.1 sel1 repeat family protein [Anaeroplasma bactoclasticum]
MYLDESQLKQLAEIANNGNIEIQNNLASVYLHGMFGVPQNYVIAKYWLEKAAMNGVAEAQYHLGVLYDNGWGCSQDYDMARYWYEKSAAQNDSAAQYNLGYMYYHGNGVEKNYLIAASWYEKAANQGHASAQNNLALMYFKGEGVPMDVNKAKMWCTRAANQGHAKAKVALNTVFKSTNSSTTTSKNGCYVATCVYGSYDCPQVWTLRRYRDNTLGKTWYGRTFIKIYYAISPKLVKVFGNKNWFQRYWKKRLDKKVSKLQRNGVENTPYEDYDWRK